MDGGIPRNCRNRVDMYHIPCCGELKLRLIVCNRPVQCNKDSVSDNGLVPSKHQRGGFLTVDSHNRAGVPGCVPIFTRVDSENSVRREFSVAGRRGKGRP